MDKLGGIDIKFLKGVGEARSKLLASELNIHTFRDLIYHIPVRYIDRSRFYQISEFNGEMPNVQVKGKFIRFDYEGEGAKRRLVGLFSDGRSLMQVLWFRQTKYIAGSYHEGEEYVLFGKPNFFKGNYSMVHPEIERYNPDAPPEGLRGVYQLTETLRNKNFTSKAFKNLIANLFEKVTTIREVLPPEVVAAHNLMPIGEALRNIHNPASLADLQKARERLKFEELFYVEMHILRYAKNRGLSVKGFLFPKIGNYFNTFYSNVLPFPLTGAQKRVLKEIRNDMRTGRQMNRLLQGDVGSGKTMVAFLSALMACDNGFQACIMAPTEILATQHFETISKWGNEIGLNVRLLTGSTRTKERREIHAGLLDGSLQILIGTHAVIEESVKFLNLGLVIIDEQHRFGVAQRAKLWNKNETPPHVLVMTATPIPRTLAMTVYGDLDVSVIDELPPGRKPIQTLLRYDTGRAQMYAAVRDQLRKGRQVYIVYPLIHENEKLALKSLEEGYENICSIFPEYKVSYVHGQLRQEEKDRQMNSFVAGETQILVATTVIEVGVNVPNASVMIIENAERFGLSQLHQLRGRVGRGADQSYCILMTHVKIGKDTRQRLEIMTQTSDGFLISEADMKLRGPGDLEGTLQSGIAFNLKIANLTSDGQIIQVARESVLKILDANPSLTVNLENPQQSESATSSAALSYNSINIIKRELKARFTNQYDWGRIS